VCVCRSTNRGTAERDEEAARQVCVQMLMMTVLVAVKRLHVRCVCTSGVCVQVLAAMFKITAPTHAWSTSKAFKSWMVTYHS
jgi:hypothetical protein